MDTIIIVTIAVLSYLYFWDFEKEELGGFTPMRRMAEFL